MSKTPYPQPRKFQVQGRLEAISGRRRFQENRLADHAVAPEYR